MEYILQYFNYSEIEVEVVVKLRIFALAITLLSIPAISHAGIINGYATNGIDDVKIGNYWGDKIKYYIPIDPSGADGQYGVNGYGMSSDSAYAPLGGPVLRMSIFFDIPDGMKGDMLTLWFGDLDLSHLNTPQDPADGSGFFETINFVDGLGSITSGINDEWSDLSSLANVSVNDNGIVPPNNSNVTVTISDLHLSGNFWLNLEFTAYDINLSDKHKWYNTKEKLSATLHTSVPEPAIIALFGVGLLGLGMARRRTRS